jgi:hypothetical protein
MTLDEIRDELAKLPEDRVPEERLGQALGWTRRIDERIELLSGCGRA